jgi:hypothetical protein
MSAQPRGESETLAAAGPVTRDRQQTATANERTAEDHLIRGYN